jgi:hypothetical protein
MVQVERRRRVTDGLPRSREGLADIQIRGIRRTLWVALRVEAARRQEPAGRLLNTILDEWLARHAPGAR